MKIEINDTYYIDFDGMNYTPFKFRKGGDEVLQGKYKGSITEDKWVSSNKFFNSLHSALIWVNVDSIVGEGGEISLSEYINTYQQGLDKLIEACKGV